MGIDLTQSPESYPTRYIRSSHLLTRNGSRPFGVGLEGDALPADDAYGRLRMSRRVQLDADQETARWFSSAED